MTREEIEGMIQSQEDWCKKAERGTSGDMVSDILHDWKLEREFLLAELDKMEERVKGLEYALALERNNNRNWIVRCEQAEARLQKLVEAVERHKKQLQDHIKSAGYSDIDFDEALYCEVEEIKRNTHA